MYGAILGDMIGAPYENDRGNKTKDFSLFIDDSRFTDDGVMTIAVAEASYRVPEDMIEEGRRRLPADMLEVIDRFNAELRPAEPFHDSSLDGNERIEEAISKYYQESTWESLTSVLDAIRCRMDQGGHFMIPYSAAEDGSTFAIRTVESETDDPWMVLFTSPDEYKKGEPSSILPIFIDTTLRSCLDLGHKGFILNPWGQAFKLKKELIQLIFDASDGDIGQEEGPLT